MAKAVLVPRRPRLLPLSFLAFLLSIVVLLLLEILWVPFYEYAPIKFTDKYDG